MTDDDRLLEIATRIAENSTEQCGGRTYLPPPEFCVKYAADLIAAARERTGAREERGQDVDDDLIARMVSVCITGNGRPAVLADLREIQRARAAGKGE